MQLQNISNIIPASFNVVQRKDTHQVELIVELLTRKIEAKEPVTIDDIRDIYAEYSMKKNMHRAGFRYEDGKWIKSKTKQEWLDSWCSQWRAVPWFKQNLGAAILRGRLLAIPVIDLNELTPPL